MGPSLTTHGVDELRAMVGSDHVLTGEALVRYRLGVATPSTAVLPGDESDVSRILRLASREGLAVVPWGGGAHQSLGRPPARYDLALDLARMSRLVEHEPADMTATVQAGMPLAEFQRSLGRHGQFLALDPPQADRASLGGMIAANLSGPLRCRYGTARDLVLGIRVCHADGTVTKGGAKVVKNATAYDITKLYVGSHGTLGVILEATVRLYPRPAAEEGWWLSTPDLARAQALATRILGSHLLPNRVELLDEAAGRACGGPASCSALLVSCAGVPEAVKAQRSELEEMARQAGATLTPVGEPERTWTALRDFPWTGAVPTRAEHPVIWRGSLLPADCAKGMQAIRQAIARWGAVSVVASVAHGILRGAFHAGTMGALRTSLEAAREALGTLGGFLVVVEAPAPFREQVDVWGPPADGLGVMQRLKAAFDPGAILNPGRFVGGI